MSDDDQYLAFCFENKTITLWNFQKNQFLFAINHDFIKVFYL